MQRSRHLREQESKKVTVRVLAAMCKARSRIDAWMEMHTAVASRYRADSAANAGAAKTTGSLSSPIFWVFWTAMLMR